MPDVVITINTVYLAVTRRSKKTEIETYTSCTRYRHPLGIPMYLWLFITSKSEMRAARMSGEVCEGLVEGFGKGTEVGIWRP